jgi:hypothetical protein
MDPYRDVSLDVLFISPSGKEVRFWGFYDDGKTWRIRFMAKVGLGSSGKQYLVYLENGGSVNVKIKGEPYRITWIKGEDTLIRIESGISPDGLLLKAPDHGDWFLNLTNVLQTNK